jgi:hypothetical protein
VHVDDDIEAFLAGPLNDAVQQGESFGIIGLKELVVNWDADGIETGLVQKMNIIAGDVVFSILMPENCRIVRTEQFGYEAFDLTSRLRAAIKGPHVALGYKPVAQIGCA